MKKIVHLGITENGSINFKIHHSATDEDGEEVVRNIRDTFMPGDDIEVKKAKYPGCDFTLLEKAVAAFHTSDVIASYVEWKTNRKSKFI